MRQDEYPVVVSNADESSFLLREQALPSTLLSSQMRQRLLADLQELAQIEYEFMAAQQVLSHIDLYALEMTYDTLASAELLQAMYGWPEELAEFDRQRRQQYLQTMHELVTTAHAKVLGHLKGD